MKDRGFTLFIAIMVMGSLLLIALGIISLAVREALISSSAQESQYAFYAADSGIECALYWDVQNPSGVSAFATSTTSTITCNGSGNISVEGSPNSNFTITFLPEPYCALVSVNKVDLITTIESLGYNTCNASALRRVERAIRVIY